MHAVHGSKCPTRLCRPREVASASTRGENGWYSHSKKRSMRQRLVVLALIVISSGLACGGSNTPTGVAGQVTHLQKATGSDDQGWYVGNPLPTDYTVTALDANNVPVKGVVTTWAV